MLGELLVSTRWYEAAVAFVFLLFFHWFATTTHELIVTRKFCLDAIAPLLAFPVLLVVLFLIARKASGGHLDVRGIDPPLRHKVLVLFLSPPGPDSLESIRGDIRDDNVLELFGRSPWRMPMIAIAHHIETLQKVVIIPSKDSPGLSDGTWRFQEAFKEKVGHLCSRYGKQGQWLESAVNMDVKWSGGVDFESPVDLVEALNHIFNHLKESGFRDQEIIVDITGGQKLNSVVGAAVALDETRCFQYVSTRDRRISQWDLQHLTD